MLGIWLKSRISGCAGTSNFLQSCCGSFQLVHLVCVLSFKLDDVIVGTHTVSSASYRLKVRQGLRELLEDGLEFR